jgi:tRNA (guanine37-N1)-methyltransferase
MNLPAAAPEFLDAFRGWTLTTLPQIHVYCFASKQQQQQQHDTNNTHLLYDKGLILERCSKALGCNLHDADIHVVRNVAPNKNMLCVSFPLPAAAAALEPIVLEKLNNGGDDDTSNDVMEPSSKRAKSS